MSELSRADDAKLARDREMEMGARVTPTEADHVRVSIVIPARNEEEYIAAALASVATQTYPADCLECVVVDNGSTDATAAIACEFATRHPQLHIQVVSEPLPGVSRAKNRGAAVATGAIFFFLDADSRMAPNLVQDIVREWRAGASAGCVRIVADSDSILERGFFNLIELGPVVFGLRSQMPYCEAALFHTLGGFQEDLQLAEDLDFFQRARVHLGRQGMGKISHIRSSTIATSPRRLRAYPMHLSIVTVFVRWALASAGIGRRRHYS